VTNVSVTDDYTMAVVSPTPVVTMFTLFQPQPVETQTPLGTVDPEPVVEDAPAVEAPEVEAKVVKPTPRGAAKASTEGVETK
jgi:hypothetical protein